MRIVKLSFGVLALAASPVIAGKEAKEKIPLDEFGLTLASLAARTDFSGELAIQQNSKSISIHTGVPDPETPWRWASVTKQVIAVLVMQEVAKSRISLDAPVSRYLSSFQSGNASKISVRQLLLHQSGLPNPDDAAGYYTSSFAGNRDPLTGYCAGKPKTEPGGNWAYNNCDYMVAGALLEAVTGQSWKTLVQKRIAKPLGLKTLHAFPTVDETQPGLVGKEPEPALDYAAYGASAGLYGSAKDMLRFGSALLGTKLLPKKQRDEMWNGRPELGFMALGQWVFEARLEGCDAPVKIVERRGAIGGVQVRNFILPDQKIAAVAFSNQGNFDFGEIWQGAGFSYEYLSTVACL